MNLQVATTILRQLGGARFMAMTGCRNPAGGANYLSLKLRRNKSGAGYLKVTLTPEDVYTMEFIKYNTKTFEPEVKVQKEGVYCDNLEEVFTEVTGLYTRL